jgi:hypothetical protein
LNPRESFSKGPLSVTLHVVQGGNLSLKDESDQPTLQLIQLLEEHLIAQMEFLKETYILEPYQLEISKKNLSKLSFKIRFGS